MSPTVDCLICAGREIRIMVESEKISIKSEREYPRHVRVTVIRETRAVDYVK